MAVGAIGDCIARFFKSIVLSRQGAQGWPARMVLGDLWLWTGLVRARFGNQTDGRRRWEKDDLTQTSN